MKKIAVAMLAAVAVGTLSSCDLEDSLAEEEKNDTPTKVTEGKAFTHDDFKAESGWRVAKERFGGVTIKSLTVTNDHDDRRTALLTFRFYKGKKVLAEVECSSNQMSAEETSALDCFSTAQKFPTGYDSIKIADMF